MRKIVLGLALALGLGACANIDNAYNTITGATVSPAAVYIARNSFDTLEVTSTNYIRYCTAHRGAVGCNATAIKQIIPAVRSGRVARNNLIQFQKDNPGALGPTGLYNALVAATNTLSEVQTQYNIGAVGK